MATHQSRPAHNHKKDGTYVQGHYKTAKNQTVNDNFSTKGNTNPYTGKPGWVPRENATYRNQRSDNEVHSSIVFNSKKEFKQWIVKLFNDVSSFLREVENPERPFLFPIWELDGRFLKTQMPMDVYEPHEEYLVKETLKFYIGTLMIIFKEPNMPERIEDFGFSGFIVETKHNRFKLPIKDFQDPLLWRSNDN